MPKSRRPKPRLNTLTQLYDGGIHHVDSRVAQVWQALQKSERDTILVLTSDHGEAFYEHRYLGHSNVLWEEVVRIPWIVWAPGRIPAGTRIDTAAQTVDLMPTIVEACGLTPPGGLPGLNLLDATACSAREAVFGAAYSIHNMIPGDPGATLQYRWCVTREWKLLLRSHSVQHSH